MVYRHCYLTSLYNTLGNSRKKMNGACLWSVSDSINLLREIMENMETSADATEDANLEVNLDKNK